ncbi:MAG: hypothetical protein ACTSU5_16225 [Promethearchaeota archaeon]
MAVKFEEVSPGLKLVGRFGWSQTGTWLLEHGDECAVLEMPDVDEGDPLQEPWNAIGEYVEERDLYLKFVTATHDHEDHFNTFFEYHDRFPEAPVLVNASFFDSFADVEVGPVYGPRDLETGVLVTMEPSAEVEGVPVYCFEGPVFETHLDGEPLYLVSAPKHSLSDTLVVFRGCLVTASWWLGPGDPNYHNVPAQLVNESIDRLLAFCRDRNYEIHSVFSVHANEFRRGVDFAALMEQSRPG